MTRGGYTHEGERYVYPDKTHRVADWAEKRPKDACPHCGRFEYVKHRRVDRTGFTLGLLRRLLGVQPARLRRVTTWHRCERCGHRTVMEQEEEPL